MHCFLTADARPSETPIRRIVRSSNSVMQIAMRIDFGFSSFFFFPPFFLEKPLIEIFTASLHIRRHSRRRSREKVDCIVPSASTVHGIALSKRPVRSLSTRADTPSADSRPLFSTCLLPIPHLTMFHVAQPASQHQDDDYVFTIL